MRINLQFFGSRGASAGLYTKNINGKIYNLTYGQEYRTVLVDGNIKFIKKNDEYVPSVTAPMASMTQNRVYVTLDDKDTPKHITYFDKNNKRVKQIDLFPPHDGVTPHVHHGYLHWENDTKKHYSKLTLKEKRMVDRVLRIWYYNHNRQ